jgi:HAD superfamily hydrolase (TIGR01509 family)
VTNFVDAIVFDCDGVLVDSEILTIKVGQRVLADLGWVVEQSAMVEMFMGCSTEHYRQQIGENIGRTLEDGWDDQYRPWYEKVFAEELREVEGVSAAIDRIDLPRALASNSSHQHIRSSLAQVGLLGKFDGRIWSAEDVPRGKPAPDVYLRAAEFLGVTPDRCVVVEDSEFGVEAARSAGMHVLAYKSALTPAAWFRRPDITVFDSMEQLPDLVAELSEHGRIA